ncbi:dermonecrotic toxin domain-containing protein [Pseudomonas yamanorum]|uniref:dermonecrotic toxin domain-containing protein n=1 Tax=Pseudomonas yamanorum TaxID=515393 RepID=UPI003F755740
MPDAPTPNGPLTTNTLITQLTTGPTLRDVACNTLRPALKELYPQLDIDPDLAVVVSPLWLARDGKILPGLPHYEPLSGALARHAMTRTQATYFDGEHYLTYRSNTGPDIQLPVRIDAIGRLINELAPLLFIAFQEQQLDYWNQTNGPNGTHWQALAVALRSIWDLEGGTWDEDERAMAKLVYQYPDYALRLPNDKYRTRTYLVDVDVSRNERVEHLNLTGFAVLIGTHEQQTIILTYSLGSGYDKFDSLQELGNSLSGHALNPQGLPLHWRLFEPEGDFFEHQACVLIGMQIDAIDQFNVIDPQIEATEDPLQRDFLLDFNQLPAPHQAGLEWMRQALPKWLKDAPLTDLSLYSRALLDLAQLNTRQASQSYQDGIAPIRDYALQALREQMLKDHPDAARINVQKIRITVTSLVVTGLFVVPGQTETVTFDLVELALQNLIALPLGDKSVSYENGNSVPKWMTASYLEGLISQVNVGQQYPALVKRVLLDDPVQAGRRQTLYIAQLRLQLPLLALQLKIRGQFGLDELGYRYICAVMSSAVAERRVDGHLIVIRPLAFVPTLRITQRADKVDNMFVIGPQDAKAGPCLLYQPMSSTPLMQFASRANLIYAIKQDTPLRQAVLAWLPDAARFGYAQFVFPGSLASPWVLTKLLIEPLTAVVMSGPIVLTDEVLGGDYLASLFTANAQALITLADRQSVSNAEARWESFKHAGWLIFNAALPFLGKTVGTAAWIGQLMDGLDQAVQAHEVGDSTTQWSALTDVFLNLGMALVLHMANRRKPPMEPAPRKALPREEKPPVVSVTVTRQADIQTAELPLGHESPIHSLAALTRKPLSLRKTLESFDVTKPQGLGAQNNETGPHQHLYPLGTHWYAPVGERWFEVTVDENDSVIIIDPTQPSRRGPLLINNRQGQWFIDTRLRLRGSGLRSRLKRGQRLRPPRIAELREQLDTFEGQRGQKAAELDVARAASRAAPPATAQVERNDFIAKLQKRREEYEVPIRQLRSLNLLDTVPDYPGRMITYLKQQILLTRAAIDEYIGDFQALLQSLGPQLEKDSPTSAEHRRLDSMTRQLAEHLEYLHSRFKELQNLGPNGLTLVEQTRQHMPSVQLDDLKAFRVSISRFLCVQEGEAGAHSDARGALNRIAEAADLTIQSSIEVQEARGTTTLHERIEALDTLVDQFAVINQDLLDLPGEYPGQILTVPLEEVRQQTDEFAQRTVQQLAAALRERKALEPRPHTSASNQPPARKIIKTRFKGVVVGEPRPDEPSLVDVREPLTQKVIATFHEKTPGVWVKRESPHPQAARARRPGLAVSMKNGQALLGDVDRFIERTKGLASESQRLPVEIEEKVHRRAEKLEEASRAIERASVASNETDNTASAALSGQLDEAAKKLYREGHRIKLEMLKKRPPTAAHLQLLYADNEITIELSGTRRRLKGPRKDFLQEYEIREKQNKRILWYAHFHYAAMDAVGEAYTAAHLKTLEQRRLGGAFESRGDASEQAGIEIYRSEIGPQLARRLFLAPEAPSPTPGPSGSAQG